MPIKEDIENVSSSRRKHPVPQNVMDVEFKVVGDLTVRQVMYLFAGGILVYIFHKSGLPIFWQWTFMLFSGGLAISVAFVPVQERGLDRWLISFVSSLTAPTQRVWRKTYAPPSYFLADYAQIIKNEIITLTPAKSRSKLDEYLGQIETEQTNYEQIENEQLLKIQNLYTTVDTKVVTEVITQTPSLKNISQEELDSKQEFLNSHETGKVVTTTPIDRAMTNLPPELTTEINVNTSTQLPETIIKDDIKDIEKREQLLKKKVEELLKITKKAKKEFSQTKTTKSHKKNRLSFFLQKHEELKKESEHLSTQIARNKEAHKSMEKSSDRKAYEKQIKQLHKENDNLVKQLAKIQKEIDTIKKTGAPVEKKKKSGFEVVLPQFGHNQAKENKQIEKQKAKAEEEKKRAIKEAKRRQEEAKKKEHELQQVQEKLKKESSKILTTEEVKIKGQKPVTPKPQTEDGDMPPNVIHGVVKTSTGTLLEGAVVIIKDDSGDVVRALKTNQLGQFRTQTALPRAIYTVEAIKGKEKFDIISVEVVGNVLSTISLISKEQK